MPPKPNTIKADADLQLVIGVIHQLLPDGKSNGKLKIDFAGLAVYLGSGKPDSARMRWNRFIQRVDWETGKMIDAAATTSGAGDGGDCGGPSASKEDKDNKKDGLKRQLDDNGQYSSFTQLANLLMPISIDSSISLDLECFVTGCQTALRYCAYYLYRCRSWWPL